MNEKNSVIVQVDKTVVKVTGLKIDGLNINQLEKLLLDRLKSMVRIIGVTGESIEMDVYGISEEDIQKDENGIVKAISMADGITLSDLAQISSIEKIKSVDFDKIPEYHEGQCMKERWLDV